MKPLKIILTSFLFILAPGLAFCQFFTIGPKVGFNYSSLPTSSSLITNQAGKAGFQVGAFARIGNKTYIQPEVLIGSNSASFTFNSGGSASVQNATFSTLDIPVLLGHKLVSLPLLNVRIMAGPDFVSLLKNPGLQIPNPSQYTYKDFNVGAEAGLGVDVASFTIDARYNFGLSQINPNLGQRLNYFNLSIGLKFI